MSQQKNGLLDETTRTVRKPSKSGFVTEILRVIVPLLILAAGIGFFVVAGNFKQTSKTPREESGPPHVEVTPVADYAGIVKVKVDGFVVPYREMTLSAEVPGRVKSKSDICRAGRFVKAGTVLLEIDPEDYELELQRLEQELKQAELAVHEVDVQLDNLKELASLADQDRNLQSREVNRLRSLAGERVVAQSDVDRAKSTEIVSRNAVQQLTNESRVLVARRASMVASMKLAQTRVEQAKLNLRRTKITAPVDGVVVADLCEENAYLQPGSPVVRFEDTSAVEVKCNLKNDELAWLRRGVPSNENDPYALPSVEAEVLSDRGGHEYVWSGQLSRFDGIGLDENTRMYPCRILVQQPNGGRVNTAAADSAETFSAPVPTLVRGMYVRVELDAPGKSSLVEVPKQALRLGNVVWKITDDKLEIVPVTVAQRLSDSVVLETSSVALGRKDQVVVSPLTSVTDGMSVTVMDNAPEAETEVPTSHAAESPRDDLEGV